MLDPLFGSHFVQSAIDLATSAQSHAQPPANVQPNKPEAIRLYKAAIADMEQGVQEIELLKDKISNADNLKTRGLQYIEEWRLKLEAVQNK